MTLNRKEIAIALQVLYWTMLLYLLCLMLMIFSFRVFAYENLLEWCTNQNPDGYLINEYGLRYFTMAHYLTVQKSAPLLIILLFVLIIILIWKRSVVIEQMRKLIIDVSFIWKIVVGAFSDLSSGQKWILAFCYSFLIAIKIYLFVILPYYVDEVFNFVYFAEKGFLNTILFSNNHVLYNLTTALWWKMGMTPIISSRLTSMIAGFLIHIFLYAISRHYFNFRTAVFVLVFTGITFWGNVFSVEGTAYMLMSLCCVISLIALLKFMEDYRCGYYLFILSSILGFYCSKLFVIPFLSFLLLWAGVSIYQGMNRRMVITFFKSVLVVVLVSGLLYLPMLLCSGSEVFFLTTMQRHDFVRESPMLFEILSVMTEVNSKSYLLILGSFILSIIFFRKIESKLKVLIALNISLIISLLLFILVFRIYPPARIFIYTNILFSGMLAVAIFMVIAQLKIRQQIITGLFIVLLKGWSSLYIWNYGWQNVFGSMQDTNFYQRLYALTNCIMMHKPKLIFMDRQDTFLNFYLTLNAIEKDKRLNFAFDPYKKEMADIHIVQDSVSSTKENDFGIVLFKDSEGFVMPMNCKTVQQ